MAQPRRSLVTGYLDAAVNVDIATGVGADGRRRMRRRDPQKIRALVTSLARHVSTSAGQRVLADDADLSRDTVRDYLDALEAAKRRAQEQGCTLGDIVEQSLQVFLARPRPDFTDVPDLPVFDGGGGFRPGVDPSSNTSMLDAVDDSP